MMGGWVKMSTAMVGKLWKIEKKKKNWLKRPKAVPQKTKFGPKFKMIQNLIFKIIFLNFYIHPQGPGDIIRDFF